MRIFSNETLTALQKALDAATLRQSVLAHNIANVNTPGFKRSYVVFEEALRQALRQEKGLSLAADEEGHFRSSPAVARVTPKVETDYYTSIRQDGNNVDTDVEMAQVAMNTINYYVATAQLNNRLSILRYVINEGRK